MTQTFGSLLRRYRRAAGLTQESLAERVALSTRGIQDLERGVSQTPRTATIDLLATALGLPESDRAELRNAAGLQPQVSEGSGPSHFGSTSRLVPLVGRRAELAALDRLLLGGDAGAGTATAPLLLLAGEPGIGKTRLLQAAAQQAVGQGWSVLAGGGYRRGGQEPYSPILDALARYLQLQLPARLTSDLEGCEWLVHLLPELAGVLRPPAGSTVAPDQERRMLFTAVARMLGNVPVRRGRCWYWMISNGREWMHWTYWPFWRAAPVGVYGSSAGIATRM